MSIPASKPLATQVIVNIPRSTAIAMGEEVGLETLDILSLSKSRWFEAVSSDGARGVLGIMKDKGLPNNPRKRRRVGSVQEDDVA